MSKVNKRYSQSELLSLKTRLGFIFFTILFGFIFPQIAGATIFQPGATLEPDCAPGSANCGVAVFSLNSETTTIQTLVVGSSGTDFSIVSASGVHTFNIPNASAATRGLLTAADWTTFNAKLSTVNDSNWSGAALALANGGTGTTNGSITGTGALSFISNTTNALTLDSGTTGAVNLGTGVNAKTITIGNSDSSTTVALTGGNDWSIDGAGTGNFTTMTGSGLTNCVGANQKLQWTSATNTFSCANENVLQTRSFNDPADVTWVDNNTTELFTTPASRANITPTSAANSILVMVSVAVSAGGTSDSIAVGVTKRGIGATATCSSSAVGPNYGTFHSENAADAVATAVFLDSPATTNNVSYTLCSTTDSVLQSSQIKTDATITLIEVSNTTADLAEMYSTNDASIVMGDLVSLDPSLESGVQKSLGAYDRQMIGIVSTAPAMVIGGTNGEGVSVVPVALSGRVSVKVTTENGPIVAGDYLTSSSVPGVAMKSMGSGPVIGQAMSSYGGEEIGLVLVFVKNFSFSEPVTQTPPVSVVLEEITPTAYDDGSDNGLATLVATIQAETAFDPVAIITAKIADGSQFLTDFLAARVTAIRGYFDEIFAEKVSTRQLCLEKSDGTELCINGEQVEALLENVSITPQLTPVETPVEVPVEVPSEILPPLEEAPVEAPASVVEPTLIDQ